MPKQRSRLQERILDELADEDVLNVLELSGQLDRSLWQVQRSVQVLAVGGEVEVTESRGPTRVAISEDGGCHE